MSSKLIYGSSFAIFLIGITVSFIAQSQSVSASMDTLFHWVNSNQAIEGRVLNLPHIQYETNSHDLTRESKMAIDTLVYGLQEVNNLAISIGGHTDDVGDERYNIELSERRAQAVYNYLIDKGIEVDRLDFRGFGKSSPLVPNTSAANRALNRRVEIVLKLRDDIQVEHVSQSIYLANGRVIPVKEYSIEETVLSYQQYGSKERYTEPLSNVQYILGVDGRRRYENPTFGFRETSTKASPTPVTPPKVPANPNDYSGYYIGVGGRSTNIESVLISLNYVDESPSRDSFSGEKTLKEQEFGISFDFGLQYGNLRGYHMEFGGSGITGSVNFLAFHIGYGNNFALGATGKTIIRPVLGLEFGRAKSPMGKIVNNDTYIRVNQTDFYSDEVAIKIISNQGTIKPRVDLCFPAKRVDNHSLFSLSLGYSYNIYSNEPMIKFTGTNSAGESVRAKENLEDDNVDFRMDGARSTEKLPFNLNGPFVGFSYKF
ncbi:hypothetical protein ADIS_3468 [Lunatimonas lonarensis]|uniref:OmpA-like domain-containing protein n=1 Tax=Lunatimonas lonarensis TaxID=1232681 RepID=R7ZQF1_9BACT|nr:OmpA family protein [Lunatimonas lonarensis]EON76340.1 hypothetical protein ADIS_3468 [Lunatimonas lonarensis]